MNIPSQLKPYRFCRINLKEKKPFEKDWPNIANYPYETAIMFIGENYGTLTGKLRILDDDTKDKRLINLFLENFGPTFRVRDHLYFEFTNGNQDKIIFYDSENNHLGELQGKGQQCVGPGSIHPSGEVYDIRDNHYIVLVDYDLFCEVFKDYLHKSKKNIIKEFKKTSWTGESITDIPLTSIISLVGLTDMGNGCYQGPHPYHGSKGGMNFRIDTNDNTWFCYRCWTGGGPSELIAVMEGISDCSLIGKNCFTSQQGQDIIKVAREKYGLKVPEKSQMDELKPMGWALSINIKRLSERKGWTHCPKCLTKFSFDEVLGFFKCQCSKGGLKKFVKLNKNVVNKNKTNIPIFKAYPISGTQCAFFCPACQKIHKHGLGDGHRTAHCFFHGNRDSPFESSGYELKMEMKQ